MTNHLLTKWNDKLIVECKEAIYASILRLRNLRRAKRNPIIGIGG